MGIEYSSNKTKKNRGKCMKRLLSITMTVLLAALLMVSCNVETGNIDDSLALITFSAGERETRSLTRTNPQLDPDDFYWTYKATKKDGTGLTTGATATEKAVVDGAKGLGTTVGPFSYGVWEFELFGYADYENGTYKNLAYNGKASITIKAAENALVVTVESKQTEGVKGHLDFPAKGDIKLTGKDINSDSVAYSSLIEQITFKRVDITTQSDEIVYNYENTEGKNSLRRKDLNSGSYAVTFTYWQNATLSTDKQTFTQGDGYKVAEETIYVAIADYLTTTIGGDIASNTGSVKISVKNGIVEVKTAPATINSDGATTIDVGAAPVSKDETKDTTAENAVKTTISIPSGALTGTTVSATTTSYTREAVASSKPTFTIEEKTTTGDGTTTTTTEAVVLGGLDIDLYVDNSTEKATDFSGENKALTITTYIATGLNGNQNYTYSETTPTCDIAVKYDGEGADGTVKSYNATTGELVFEVTHLSTYYFVSKSTVVFNTTKSSAYDKFEDAITAASSGDTLTLLKSVNVTGKDAIKIDKSLTIDLGGNTITSSNRLFWVHNGTLTLDNGTIKIADDSNIAQNSSMIRVSCDDNCTTTEALGFVLKKGATIEGTKSYGVTVFGTKDATVDIYGTITSFNACLAGNGSTDGKITMNVYDGATLTATGNGVLATKNQDSVAIYQPNDGILNIYGGTITSQNFSAVEIRAGKANISGGTLKSGATYECKANGDGPTTKGAAVAVAQHTTKYNIGVVITGGTFNGAKQLVVVDPQNNKLDNVKVEIKSECNFAADKIYAEKSSSSDGVVGTYTIAPDTLWDGVSATTDWYSADSNSFEISKASDLAGLAKLVNEGTSFEGKTVTLAADIDLGSKEWTPIGDSNRKDNGGNLFKGTFDGKNHSVYNIVCNESEDNMPSGFFGSVEGATIKNLIIGGIKDESGEYKCDGTSKLVGDKDCSAGVVAFILGSETTTVDNCTNYATIEGADPAGIVGRAYNEGDGSLTTISNCKNYGEITCNSETNQKAGGILAINNSTTTVSNCINNGAVTGSEDNVGGIVGYANVGLSVTKCTNNGKITNNSSSWFGGGIVGRCSNAKGNVKISECMNTGEVSGTGSNGGIAGDPDEFIEIEDCTNKGKVSGNVAGGVAASLSGGSIKKCSNEAEVSATTYAGGVVAIWGSSGGGTIENCSGGSASISVKSGDGAGRVVGVDTTAYGNPDATLSIPVSESSDDTISTIGIVGGGFEQYHYVHLEVLSGSVRNLPKFDSSSTGGEITFKAGVTLYDSTLEKGSETFTVDTVYKSSESHVWERQ